MYYAVRPLYIGLSYYTANNHLLNTLLMHVSAAVFGMKPWAIRLPVFLAGSMIPLLTFAAVRKLHGTGAALIAAGLIAGSSPLIEYSVNARGYSLAAAFIMLSILLSAIALKDGLRGAWMMLPVGAALALYSVPVTLYGVAGLFATFLALDRRHTLRWLAAMTATGAITTVLYSPVLLSVGLRAITANQWVAPLPAEVWPQAFLRELRALLAYWSMDMPVFVAIVVLAGVLLTIALAMRHRRLPALLLCLGATCIAAIALCWFQQVVPPRRSWLYILPLYFSCAAIGLAGIAGRVSRRREAVAAGMAAVLTCAMAFNVLRNQTLTSHSGLERVGLRSAPDIIQGVREPLARGGTFICADYFDSSLDFELRAQGVRYQPSDSGPLIIVAPAGGNAKSILGKAGIPESQISELRFVRRFADADVYLATRMPGLHLPPGGTTESGMFTSAYQQ